MMKFEPINEPLLAEPVAKELLEAKRRNLSEVTLSFDLALSKELCRLTRAGVEVRGRFVDWKVIEESAKRPRDVYVLRAGAVEPAAIVGEHFYKLVLVKWGRPPTLEIDGIHMHRVKDITPDEDTKLKLRNVESFRGKSVLDTCMGLGYTAIGAISRGAASVVTVEVDRNVLELARINPWSRGLDNENVEVILGDVYEVLDSFGKEFNVVIHDPPRLSLAGHLYSLEFYKKLATVLKPNGILIHYVGQPGIKRGIRLWVGVMKRLREAGFSVRFDEISMCVVARLSSF
ncbi:MAG: RsmD family RNA methyltransferase [Thaumarchaeota archaeon]|jgi:predicted methyltransferase|nr:RsmD family RNA methyltransferase [Candidatus Terraquivivens yellowstonensis]MCL7387812.1 RsmD family RNA methyltransferase [Candidatus Terraquivivens yellowstonensis]MCL7395304.1 RsmD family RNA methyltransferase [Candidatus Terraquivivens yellowstonensis]MCL7397505.1 RsmD family RNA methyltransferase [Candidatus Terraquivivens yellowstonensis]MCL7400383.1 RsmD family RNA methyltransferase [Candidatus Terraquivivens yellowstonensis]